MNVVKTVKSGKVEIEVQEYADGRFGFDFHNEEGQRVKCRRKEQAKAIEQARERAKIISAGRVDMMTASRQEWAAFEAWQRAGLSMEELAEFRTWKSTRSKTKTVAEIRNELLALKREDSDLDPVYVGNLAGPWEEFCRTFGKRSITEVEPSEVETWLRELKKAARTRNNIRDVIVQLFRFAREREYLPDAISAAEKVKRLKIKARADDIEIWTPAEMRLLLAHAKREFLPWLLFGGFTGIRTNEIRPRPNSRKDCLRWEDVLWSESQISIRPEVAKTGRQRYIPIPKNLLAWLAPYSGKTGPVIVEQVHVVFEDIDRMVSEIQKKEKDQSAFVFKKNALRHSFGSYRNAVIRNIGQLADEMGNSPAIAKRNYERPQPRAVADEWFGIMPAE